MIAKITSKCSNGLPDTPLELISKLTKNLQVKRLQAFLFSDGGEIYHFLNFSQSGLKF